MYTVSDRVAHVLMNAFEWDEAQVMQLVKALSRLGIYIVDGNDLSATAHYELTGHKGGK